MSDDTRETGIIEFVFFGRVRQAELRKESNVGDSQTPNCVPDSDCMDSDLCSIWIVDASVVQL